MATLGAKLSPVLPEPELRVLGETASPPSHVSYALFTRRMLIVGVDLLSVWCGALIAVALRFSLRLEHNVGIHAGFLLLYSGLIILFSNTQKLYSGIQFRSSRQETIAVLRATVLASIFLTAVIYGSGLKSISRLVVMLTISLSFFALAGSRYLRRRRLERAPADGFNCRNALIVGAGKTAQALHAYLDQHRYLGYVPAGFITADRDDSHHTLGVLGSLRNLQEIARAHFIDELIVTTHNRAAAKAAIAQARECGLGVRLVPDLYDGLAWGAPVEYVGQFPTLCLDQKRIPALSLVFKRALDMVLSGAALLCLLPFLIVLALAVKLDSAGPVFYTSDRVGRKGLVFRIHKFRTMVQNADQLLDQLQHLNERDGVLFKISNDPRITRLGRFLRKYSLDELPQLWNVFKGDMSLVGPRPPLASEVRQYEIDHLKRLDVLPGITGLWQVQARTDPSFESYIALDIQYVERWNLLLDLRILLKTAAVVFAGTGK